MKFKKLFFFIGMIYLVMPYTHADNGSDGRPGYGATAGQYAQGIIKREDQQAQKDGRTSRVSTASSGSTHSIDLDAEVANLRRQWQQCVSDCQRDNQKTRTECEHTSQCVGFQTQYEHYKGIRDNNERKQADHDNAPEDGDNAGAKRQVGNQKDKTKALAWVGAGTTAFLGLQTAQCFPGCATSCGKCFVLAGMTALAAAQTAKMFDEAKDLGNTEGDMGGREGDGSDGGAGIGCQANPEICSQLHENRPEAFATCMQVGCALSSGTPPSGTQPTGTSPSGPDGISPPGDKQGPNGDYGTFVAAMLDKQIPPPPGGWPGGKPPFKPAGEGFEYESLTPEQKAEVNRAMKGFNQRKKAFMSKHGLLKDKKSKKKLAKKEELSESLDVPANFSTMAEGELDSVGTGSQRRGRPSKSKKEPSTADKISAMLNQMGRKPQSDPLAKKSVSLKNDKVGVREDNIFIMVHRMNRRLDEEDKYFIRDF